MSKVLRDEKYNFSVNHIYKMLLIMQKSNYRFFNLIVSIFLLFIHLYFRSIYSRISKKL